MMNVDIKMLFINSLISSWIYLFKFKIEWKQIWLFYNINLYPL